MFDEPVFTAGFLRLLPLVLQATFDSRLASKNGGEFQPSQFPIIAEGDMQAVP